MASVALVLCFASVFVVAAEVPAPQCPQKMTVQQYALKHQAGDWKIVNSNASQPLAAVAISTEEYPTVQTGFDVPTIENLPKGDRIAHYDTTPLPTGLHDYWVICQYRDSAVVLVQRLPENVRRCEVLYRNDVTIPERVTIKCFDTLRAKN
ncbi:MAG: hypothetical protein FWH55_12805 [Oscillospiraceae bacterium]|nr:hypothetical protein [Oscillospiraceae bacterium]